LLGIFLRHLLVSHGGHFWHEGPIKAEKSTD
jgi:hypothetical protein